jgi:hypothetical protein
VKDLPVVRCPAGRLITEPLSCVCRIMEEDQDRRDSVLEGAPVGVQITAADDASTFFNFCCGEGVPSDNPDSDPRPHYTSCPIWAAGQEIEAAKRAFAPEGLIAPTLGVDPEPGKNFDPDDLEPTAAELREFLGIEV